MSSSVFHKFRPNQRKTFNNKQLELLKIIDFFNTQNLEIRLNNGQSVDTCLENFEREMQIVQKGLASSGHQPRNSKASAYYKYVENHFEVEEIVRYEVLKMLKKKDKITDVVIENLLSWRRSGSFFTWCIDTAFEIMQ